jgi:hypothetical protein
MNSVKFRPESGEIQFLVPVYPEPEQDIEIPVPERVNKYSGFGNTNRNCVWSTPVSGSGS